MVEIFFLDNDVEWDNYVYSNSQGTPFHLTSWRDAISKAFAHNSYFFVARQNGKICGILPLTHVKSLLFGNILSSVAFAAYGGIIADSVGIFDLLLAKAKAVARQYDVDYLELKFLQEHDCGLPKSDLYVTFVKELFQNYIDNFNAIPRKQRAMIRKGIKSGLKVIVSNDCLDDFYEIYAINVRRMGTPVYPKKWFKELIDAYGDSSEIMVVEKDGKIISGVLSFYYKDTVYPYYAASLVEYRKFAPNDFQYWELMKRAVDRECRYFDYGRSKKHTGPFDFKRHWGFEPQQLHYSYILNKAKAVPSINPLNPKYKWKIDVWKKLPLPVTKVFGPHIVKNIP